jgi:hypothetical protein
MTTEVTPTTTKAKRNFSFLFALTLVGLLLLLCVVLSIATLSRSCHQVHRGKSRGGAIDLASKVTVARPW